MVEITKTSRTAIIFGLLLIMLVLQFAAINMRSFWEDETVTGWLVNESFETIIDKRGNNNHPPLYWLSVAIWSNLAGNSDKALKIYSTAWLVVTFVLIYKLAADLLNERVALISAGLFALSPIVLTYGHNARYYSMSAALSLLSTLSVYRYLVLGRKLWLVIYIISGIALIYTVYMGGTILLALNLWWLIIWFQEKRKKSDLVMWGLAQVTILLAYIPWLSTFIGATDRNIDSIIVDNWLLAVILRIGYLGFAFEVGEFYSPLNPIVWLGLIVSTILVIYSMINASRKLWLLVIVILVSLGLSVVVNIIAVYPQSAWQNLSNRTFFSFPFFIIMLAYGISKLKGKWFPVIQSAIFIVYGVGIFNYFTNQQVVKPILTVPWREILSEINSQATADAVIVCTNDDVACFYYQSIFGYDRIAPQQLLNVLEHHPSEIWWVQSNRGEFSNFKNTYIEQFTYLQEQYIQEETFHYVPHDPGIALLKSNFLGQKDFEYRVIVYKFVAPED